MRILVENAKDGFITLETEYAMHYGNKKLKVSSLGKIRSNLPTTLSVKNLVITNLEPSFSLYTHQPWYIRDIQYPVLMKAMEIQGAPSPQGENYNEV